MNEPPRIEVRQLRHRVSHAEYHVDSRAVADAIVRRRWAVSVGTSPSQARVRVVTAPHPQQTIESLAA
jgi:hypothetical protein